MEHKNQCRFEDENNKIQLDDNFWINWVQDWRHTEKIQTRFLSVDVAEIKFTLFLVLSQTSATFWKLYTCFYGPINSS